MAEQRPWILNLAEIDVMSMHVDDDIDGVVKSSLRSHIVAGLDDDAIVRDNLLRYDLDVLTPGIYQQPNGVPARGFIPVFIDFQNVSDGLKLNFVRDWLAEVHIHSPRHHRAILSRRMSFAQMIDAATRWHAAQYRAAERLRNRAIVRDAIGAPTVMDLDGEWLGWRWVWLKSDDARDAEGNAMGNCVGRGYYDGLAENAGVFSLRDPRGEPHVTVELDGLSLQQAECCGGAAVSEKFRPLVDRMVAIIGLRLEIHGDPTLPVADGVYIVDGLLASDRVTYYVAGGVLHRDGGPARISEGAGIYYDRGVETRSICVWPERRETTYYICRMIDDLAERFPGDSYYSVGARYRLETRVDIDGEILDHRWSGRRNAAATAARIRRVPPAVNAPTPEVRP